MTWIGCLMLLIAFQGVLTTQIRTKNGDIRGSWILSRNGKPFLAFRGIPYAKPPVGDLRFREPQPFGKWRGVLNATNLGNACLQLNGESPDRATGSEDCLYLNVFTPSEALINSKRLIIKKLLPVLLYIHGGCFELGSGHYGYNPAYLMDEGITVVTLNYRLAALGFLTFEDEELPGNLGLKDQLLALKWVRENIKYFGGDPHKVTLYGVSAGAASVHYHLLSPLSRGLFRRGIAFSGSGYSPWALSRNNTARGLAMRTAELLGCLQNTTKEMLYCMREKDAKEIIELRLVLIKEYVGTLCLYNPVLDEKAEKPFLPKYLNSLEPAQAEVMFGITSADGLLKTANYYKLQPSDWTAIDSNFSSYIKRELLNQPNLPGLEIDSEKLKIFYFGNQSISEDSIENITRLFTDGWFWIPMVEAYKHHPQPVHTIYFDYLGVNTFSDKFASQRKVEGACHLDQDIYIWNEKDQGFQPLTGKDLEISIKMVKIWGSFVKFGKFGLERLDHKWGDWQYRKDYLNVSSSGFEIKNNLLDEDTKLWYSLNLLQSLWNL